MKFLSTATPLLSSRIAFDPPPGMGSSGQRRYDNVAGFSQGGNPVTGAIVFVAPFGLTNLMQSHEVVGYNYASGTPFRLRLSFYDYAGGGVVQPSVEYLSQNAPTVRMGRTVADSKIVIILGDITTDWVHPKVQITTSFVGHTMAKATDDLMVGWTSTIVTDLSAFTQVNTAVNASLAGPGSSYDQSLQSALDGKAATNHTHTSFADLAVTGTLDVGTADESFTGHLNVGGLTLAGSSMGASSLSDTSMGGLTISAIGANGVTVDSGLTVSQPVRITASNDANATSANTPPLLIGNPQGNHMRVDGNEFISMASDTNMGNIFIHGTSVQLGATDKVTVTSKELRVGTDGDVNGGTLRSGSGGPLTLAVASGETRDVNINSTHNVTISSPNALVLPDAYNDTTSASANVAMTTGGRIRRATSSRRYKVNLDRTTWRQSAPLDAIKALTPTTYHDKRDAEGFASCIDADGNLDADRLAADGFEFPQQLLGLIAEDLADLGLEPLITRNEVGQPESVCYDRVAVALLPWLAEIEARLTALEQAT